MFIQGLFLFLTVFFLTYHYSFLSEGQVTESYAEPAVPFVDSLPGCLQQTGLRQAKGRSRTLNLSLSLGWVKPKCCVTDCCLLRICVSEKLAQEKGVGYSSMGWVRVPIPAPWPLCQMFALEILTWHAWGDILISFFAFFDLPFWYSVSFPSVSVINEEFLHYYCKH